MSIEVWPFLVSRNRYIDYRTIVAPDFICDAKIANLLARAAEGELTKPGQGIMRQVIGSKAGNFTIAFRVIKAIEKDINLTGENNILKDQFGREIYIFEGIVARGIRKDFFISDRDFQKAHYQLTTFYQKFWDLVSPLPAIPSQPFPLDMDSASRSLVLKKLPPIEIPKSPAPPVPPQVLFFIILVVIFLALFTIPRIIPPSLASNTKSSTNTNSDLREISTLKLSVNQWFKKVTFEGSISVNSIISEETLDRFGEISEETLKDKVENIARSAGATEVDTSNLDINIPPERIGVDGNYNQSGLAQRVKSDIEKDTDLISKIPNLDNVSQKGSTIVFTFKDIIPEETLLNKMKKIAIDQGATEVDITQVEVK